MEPKLKTTHVSSQIQNLYIVHPHFLIDQFNASPFVSYHPIKDQQHHNECECPLPTKTMTQSSNIRFFEFEEVFARE